MTFDRALQHDVETELRWRRDPGLDGCDRRVTVHNGLVTLTGTVSPVGERRVAAEIAVHSDGVLAIANAIIVVVDDGWMTLKRRTADGKPTSVRRIGRARSADRERGGQQHDLGIPQARMRARANRGSTAAARPFCGATNYRRVN